MLHFNNVLDQIEDLFLRYGFKSVSMDDIAQELGISKKTLYQHTPSKLDLIKTITQRHITKDQDCIASYVDSSGDAIEEMMKIATYVLEIVKKLSPKTVYELKKYYRPIYDNWEMFHQGHIYQVIKQNVERGKKEAYYREDLDTDIVARLYMSRVHAMMDDTIFNPKDYRMSDIFIEHIKIHFYGITTSQGLKLYKKYAKNMPEEELVN